MAVTLPSGGTAGQALVKRSSSNGDVEWRSVVTPSALTALVTAAMQGMSTQMTLTPDTGSMSEDSGALTANILSNDSTGTGSLSVLRYTVAGMAGTYQAGDTATIPLAGSFTIQSSGQYTFTPNPNYNGSVPEIAIEVTNGSGIQVERLNLTVLPVADAPVAVNDSLSSPLNTPITFNPVANDTSVDGNTLTVTRINSTNVTAGSSLTITNATISVGANNSLTITPTTGFAGSVSFSYVVQDSNGLTSSATITANFVNPESGASGDYYLSPTGSDSNVGTDPAAPWKTFAYAFSQMSAGKTLVLMDGTYDPSTTGIIHYATGVYSSRSSNTIPNGTSRAAKTKIIARNAGRAVINGQLFVGRSSRKDSYIHFEGLRFEGGGAFYNTSYNVLKHCAFHGAFAIGTNDHDSGNTHNLVEDCWVWASGARVIAINYRAHYNTWRRVVVRGDGCGTAACAGSGNPNVGFTIYDSHEVEALNVVVVDRVLSASDSGYSDFACASHTGGLYMWGHNAWRGCISINSPDSGWYVEPDAGTTIDPTWSIENCSVVRPGGAGFNFAREGSHVSANSLLALMTAGDGFRLAPELNGSSLIGRNVVVVGAGTRAINSPIALDYVCVNGTWSQGVYGSYNPDPTHVLTSNPIGSAVKHPVRIEAGSFLAGAGYGGADLGPTILKRYGADGAIYGDADRTTLQATDLWPWPNEDRIKAEMSEVTTRGFCSTGARLDGVNPITLTSYVWESLGYQMPSTVYPPSAAPVVQSLPVATGQFVEGGLITMTDGVWSSSPTSFDRAWLRAGTPIPGATYPSYTLQTADIGQLIAPRVIANNSAGSSSPSVGNANLVSAATPLTPGTVTITGTPQVGNTLTVDPGIWGGAPSPSWNCQVYKDGVAVGSPGSALTFVPTVAGSYTVLLTGTNIKGSATASMSAAVTVAALPVPTLSSSVTLTGSAVQGSTLTGNVGAWTGSPSSYTIAFLRDGVAISGTSTTISGTTATYTTTGADVGHAITFSVVANNAGGSSTTATSSAITPTASTTIGDDFTGTAGTDISGRTATGTYGGFSWVKNSNFANSNIIVAGSGAAVRASASATLQPYYSGTAPGSADQTVSASITFGTSARTSISLGARMTTDSNTDGYYVNHSGGNWQLFKRVGGTTTVLGTAADAGGGTYAVDLICLGSAISVKVNGTTLLSATDTDLTAAGRCGLLSWYADTADSDLIDDWSATWAG